MFGHRFTVRRMMVAVAILGVAIWGAQQLAALVYWRADALERALRYGVRESEFRASAAAQARIAEGARQKARLIRESARPSARDSVDALAAKDEEEARVYDEFSAESKDMEDYFGALRRKHERSARYPWLAVEPDPPRPKTRY